MIGVIVELILIVGERLDLDGIAACVRIGFVAVETIDASIVRL